MKSVLNVIRVCLLSALFLSCGKDDPKPATPSIKVTSTQINDGLFKGIFGYQDLAASISGTAPQGFSKLKITKVTDGVVSVIEEAGPTDVTLSSAAFSFDFGYKITLQDVLKEVVFKAELTDKKGNKVETEITKMRALRQLKTFEITQDADDSETNIFNYDYFLNINLEVNPLIVSEAPAAIAESYNDLEVAKNYSDIHIVFDYNPVSQLGAPQGAYVASPSATNSINSKLVKNFTTKNETMIKVAEYSSLSSQDLAALNVIAYDEPHVLEEIFGRLPSGTNPQVAFLNKTTPYFIMFKTNTGQVGIMDHIERPFDTQMKYNLHLSTY